MTLKSTFFRLTALFMVAIAFQSTFAQSAFMGKPQEKPCQSEYGQMINDLCFSGENLWLATNAGLVRFNTQTSQFAFFNKENAKLPASQITSICPYTLGKIAVGTTGGVAIFDTITTEVFNSKNSPLIFNAINSKLAYIKGNLYVASILSLYIYNQTSWKTIAYGQMHMSDPNYISEIKVGAKDSLYAFKDNGIYRVGAEKLTSYFANKQITISDFQFVADTLWLATSKGLYASYNSILQKIDTANSDLTSDKILRIKLDSKQNLWLMTNKGLTLFNPATKGCTNFTNDSIHFENAPLMTLDLNDNIWLAGKQSGNVWKFDGTQWFKWNFIKSIVNTKINNFLLDHKGNLWITNHDSCFGKYNRDSSFVFDSTGIHHMKPDSILFKKNKRLIFFVNGDVIIDYTDSLSTATVITPGFTNKFAHAVYDSINAILWKATKAGLEKIQNGVTDTINIKNLGAATNLLAGLYLEKTGSILISTFPDTTGAGGQLLRFDGTKLTILFNSPKPYFWVSSIVTDADGNLWLGLMDMKKRCKAYGGGLLKMIGRKITEFRTENSGLPANSVTDISADANGNIWVATIGGGVAKFDRKGKWAIFNCKNTEMPQDSVEQVVVDALNAVYVATVDGGITYIAGDPLLAPTALVAATANMSNQPVVYPVPCVTEVNIQFSANGNVQHATITIFNLAGQKVMSKYVDLTESRLVTLPLNTLAKGAYTIKVSDKTFSFNKVLIIK